MPFRVDEADRHHSRKILLRRQFGLAASAARISSIVGWSILDVTSTKVTAAGVVELQAALPNCKIDWTPTLPPPTGDANRDAAEWVLATGGEVQVQFPGGNCLIVKDARELPVPPWTVYEADLQTSGFDNDDLRWLAGASGLAKLTIRNPKISGAALAHVAQMRGLRRLALNANNGVTDGGLVHLGRLHALRSLKLDGTRVTHAGLAHLRQLKQLQDLSIGFSSVDDRGMAVVAEMTGLTQLNVVAARITDDGLASLASLKKMKHLHAGMNVITDVGCAEIAKLTGLETLSLGKTPVGDDGIEKIRALTKLEALSLADTELTDDGLKHLRALTNLKNVDVKNTRVTAAGVAELRAALPNFEVIHQGG